MHTKRLSFFAMFMSMAFVAHAALPPLEFVQDPEPGVAIAKEAADLIGAGDTKGITELAKKYRENREHYPNSFWYLTTIYEVVTDLPGDEDAAAGNMAFFRKWAQEEPENITAQVCLAQALTNYAWLARGKKAAVAVGEDDARRFVKRLLEAQEVIDRAKKLEFCPQLFATEQVVALGVGSERDVYMNAVDGAVTKEPTYGIYYQNAFRWLLPRWYGEEGAFEKWLTQRADAAAEGDRDAMYAQLVWLAKNLNFPREIVFAPGRLDWERTKRGFDVLISRDPDNLYPYIGCLKIAMLADDRERARKMLDVIGGRFNPDWWGGGVSEFEAVRAFAYSDGPNPMRP